jgi:hypothetical protein
MLRMRTMAFAALMPLTALAAQEQDENRWTWSGTLAEGRTVYLHNVNGAVHFETGTGNTVEVIALKRWRRGDPDDVRIEARTIGGVNGDVLICAFWNPRASCDAEGYNGGSRERWNDRNDVSVEFTVRVPAFARVEANTVNGRIRIDRVQGAIRARTVNGDVEAHSSGGRVSASTVNGDVLVSGRIEAGGVEYSTVNGGITIELPADVSCDVDLSTVNGRIATDFPITFDGTIDPRRIRAAVGNGGPTVRARTVNGSIRLRKQ